MSKKIIIFDLDGTLLDTLEDLTLSTNYVLAKLGYPIKTKEQIRSYVGNGIIKLMQRALPNNVSKDMVENAVELFKNNYIQKMNQCTKPYDGILELLQNLKNNKYLVAVVSNKYDKAVKQLCCKFFPNLIDVAFGEDEENGIRKKPYPDIVFKILEYYNLKPEDAIFIGDSEVDIQTARNSNLDCISVTWGFKDKEFLLKNDARIFADTPQVIIEILKNL